MNEPSAMTCGMTAQLLQRAQSVAWDPTERKLVITVGEPQPGKSIALPAEEREGTLND